MEPQNTLRDSLAASFDKLEAGTASPEIQQPTEIKADRPRDEAGKFVEKEPKEPKPEAKQAAPEVKAEPQAVQPSQDQTAPEVKPETPKRPTTWKKEYLPIWDKIAQGEPLTAEEAKNLAKYTEQRETEYKTGVSTYRTEAMQAKALQEAVAPFMPDLQAMNVTPDRFIQNLGNAHMMLTKGTPEQKVQLFTKLAADYGIPLDLIAGNAQGQQIDNTTYQLLQEIQNLKQQVSSVAGWKDAVEQQDINSQLAEMQDTEKYPYFEMLRPNMIQFLESGQAQNLREAYQKAAEPFENLLNERIQQSQAPVIQANQQAIQKAKSAAVSPKSTTPSGKINNVDPKDRRALLGAAFDSIQSVRV